MANRRMFSKEIVTSDAFREMGLGSQALYYALGMEADDDGVVNNYRSTQRAIGANDDDMRVLVAKRFVLPIDESGIIVIKHWKINNYIQKDRYTPSKYQKELAMLGLDKNNAYTDKPECIQNGYTDKNSIDKYSKDKEKINSKGINSIDYATNPNAREENDDDNELF